MKTKKLTTRERFVNYIMKKHNIANENAITIHNSDYYGMWIEYTIVGDNLGHGSVGKIIRLYTEEVFS
jgi:hypothetical protein